MPTGEDGNETRNCLLKDVFGATSIGTHFSINKACLSVQLCKDCSVILWYHLFKADTTNTCYLLSVRLQVPCVGTSARKSALAVARALVKHVFLVFGAVEFCFTNMNREFNNEILNNVCRLLGIQKSTTTGYRPNSDGAVEKVQAAISNIFAKTIKASQTDWSEMVPYVVFAYNTETHSVTGYSPFYLMFNRLPITGIDWQLEQPSPANFENVDEFAATMLERSRRAHAIVAEQLKCAFERNKT